MAIHPIVVDRREKNPLPFPKHLEIWAPGSHPLKPRSITVQLQVVPETLPVGDYLHGGSPTGCIVERKASIGELWANLCTPDGRRRFCNELEAMAKFRRPILLLEGDPLSLETYTHKKVPISGAIVRDLLFDLTAHYRIWTVMMPSRTISQRRACGRWLAALLVQEHLRGQPDGNVQAQEPQPAGS